MSVEFGSFGHKKMLHCQWKKQIDIDKAKLSTSRKWNRLKSLTLSASLDLNTRLNREIRTSVNGGAFKKCIALMRTL
jgi:hypothetical protein